MTNKEAFIKLKDTLSCISSLSSFYIGKSDDVNRRKKEHWYKDGYLNTIEIAHSSPDRIAELEEYLIKEFLKSDIADKCDNKQVGGGDSKKADSLYVALHFVPKYDNELEDNDFDWICCEL